MSILLLGGSPSLPSSSSRLLGHIGERLARLGHRHGRLQVRDLPAQPLLHGDCDDAVLQRALALVAGCDALVIATPVYKASFSGLLKTFLDLLPHDGLAGKIVLPVATGGSQSHMLALDYALRPVLTALSARHVLASIYATSEQLGWDADGGLALAPAIAARVAAGVDELSVALHVQRTRHGGEPRTNAGEGAMPTLACLSGRSLADFPYACNALQDSHA